MPSAFNDILTVVTDALGDDSTKATSWATRGINYAHLLAALLFSPQELKRSDTMTLGSGLTTIDISSLLSSVTTPLRSIYSLYNQSAGRWMGAIPLEKWGSINPTSGNVIVYTRENASIFVAPAPSSTTLIDIHYDYYPPTLSAGSSLSFSGYDPFIISVGTKFAWAFAEEIEASKLFGELEETLKIPYALNAAMRKQFEEGARRV